MKKITGQISDASLKAIGKELEYALLIGKIRGGGPWLLFFNIQNKYIT